MTTQVHDAFTASQVPPEVAQAAFHGDEANTIAKGPKAATAETTTAAKVTVRPVKKAKVKTIEAIANCKLGQGIVSITLTSIYDSKKKTWVTSVKKLTKITKTSPAYGPLKAAAEDAIKVYKTKVKEKAQKIPKSMGDVYVESLKKAAAQPKKK